MSRFLNSAVSSVSGLFSRPAAPVPAISYGDTRQTLTQQARAGLDRRNRGQAEKLRGRLEFGLALRRLKQDIEDSEGPGQWSAYLAEHFPDESETEIKRCLRLAETEGKQEDWDRICGRGVQLTDQPENPLLPQTPLQITQPEVSDTPPPGEQGNELPDPLASLQQGSPPAEPTATQAAPLAGAPKLPRGVRGDRQAQKGAQTPHGAVGRPIEDDRPLTTSWTHHEGDGTAGVDFPRLAEGAEIVGLLRAALAAAEIAFPAPF